MATRVNLSSFRTSLSAALGLAALACGGQSALDDEQGAGGAGGTSTATGGSAPIDLSCRNPAPVLGHDGSDSGYVSCEGDFLHRRERRACASRLPRAEAVDPGMATTVDCATDADCEHLPHGHCERTSAYWTGQRVTCLAGCVEDTDCGENQVCLCGDPVGTCINAACKSDAECSGLLCTADPLVDTCTSGTLSAYFSCQKPNDTCRSDADCESPNRCFSGQDGPRRCEHPGSCGRPFLVAGEARLAGVVRANTGWSRELTPCAFGLEGPARRELTEHWARLGAMEHASVAAFARFTLELLSLGAPAELVAEAQRALGDEIRHAELCFGLASAYAGRALGPGPLSSEGAFGNASFAAIVETAFAEACIGETLAAVEAAEAAEHSTDPAVREILFGIAADERRHAELGWRFVHWALARCTLAEKRHIVQQLEKTATRARNEAPARTAPAVPDALVAHGMLTAELHGEARRAAFDELVVPLTRELLVAQAA